MRKPLGKRKELFASQTHEGRLPGHGGAALGQPAARVREPQYPQQVLHAAPPLSALQGQGPPAAVPRLCQGTDC